MLNGGLFFEKEHEGEFSTERARAVLVNCKYKCLCVCVRNIFIYMSKLIFSFKSVFHVMERGVFLLSPRKKNGGGGRKESVHLMFCFECGKDRVVISYLPTSGFPF